MWHVRVCGERHIMFLRDNVKERDLLSGINIRGKIILKWDVTNRMG
jgi:hypothetical protein